MDAWTTAVDILDKGGTLALLVGIGIAIQKRWLVPGWVYDQCAARLAILEATANTRADKMEAKLDRYEQRFQGPSHERP